jgi:hypothetical protein
MNRNINIKIVISHSWTAIIFKLNRYVIISDISVMHSDESIIALLPNQVGVLVYWQFVVKLDIVSIFVIK